MAEIVPRAERVSRGARPSSPGKKGGKSTRRTRRGMGPSACARIAEIMPGRARSQQAAKLARPRSRTARVVPLGLAAVELLAAAKPGDAKLESYVCPGEKPAAPFVGIDRESRVSGLQSFVHLQAPTLARPPGCT